MISKLEGMGGGGVNGGSINLVLLIVCDVSPYFKLLDKVQGKFFE